MQLELPPPPLLAGILGLGGAEIGIIFALLGMIFGGIMGLAGMYFHHQRKRLWHETARIALEKGQPLPPMNSDETEPQESTKGRVADHDVRGGMVLIAVGAGLWLMLGGISPALRYVGAIPGFIGVALLLYALLTRKDRQPPQDPSARS